MKVYFFTNRELSLLRLCIAERLDRLDSIIDCNEWEESLIYGFIKEREDVLKLFDRFK